MLFHDHQIFTKSRRCVLLTAILSSHITKEQNRAPCALLRYYRYCQFQRFRVKLANLGSLRQNTDKFLASSGID